MAVLRVGSCRGVNYTVLWEITKLAVLGGGSCREVNYRVN